VAQRDGADATLRAKSHAPFYERPRRLGMRVALTARVADCVEELGEQAENWRTWPTMRRHLHIRGADI